MRLLQLSILGACLAPLTFAYANSPSYQAIELTEPSLFEFQNGTVIREPALVTDGGVVYGRVESGMYIYDTENSQYISQFLDSADFGYGSDKKFTASTNNPAASTIEGGSKANIFSCDLTSGTLGSCTDLTNNIPVGTIPANNAHGSSVFYGGPIKGGNETGWVLAEYVIDTPNNGVEAHIRAFSPTNVEYDLKTISNVSPFKNQQARHNHLMAISQGSNPLIYTQFVGDETVPDDGTENQITVQQPIDLTGGLTPPETFTINEDFKLLSGTSDYQILFAAATSIKSCNLKIAGSCDNPTIISGQPIGIFGTKFSSSNMKLSDAGTISFVDGTITQSPFNITANAVVTNLSDASLLTSLSQFIQDKNSFITSMPSPSIETILVSTVSEYSNLTNNPKLYILKTASVSPSNNSTLIVTPNKIEIDANSVDNTNIDLVLDANELFAIEVACTTSNDLLTLNSRAVGDVFPQAPQSLVVDTTNLNSNEFEQAISLSSHVDSNGNFVPAPTPINASGVYASLNYNVQSFAYGQTDVICTANASDANGSLQDVNVTNATIILNNGINALNGQTVTGTVIIPEGIDPTTIVVTLTVGDVSTTTTVNENGVFTFSDIKMADITVSVNAPNAVAQCTSATVGEEAVSTGDITLYRGDINKDGVIDIADFSFLSSRFGLSEGENRYRAKADLNKDGVINIQDLAILGSALGLAACDPVAN